MGLTAFAIAVSRALQAKGVWRKLAWGLLAVLLVSAGFALPSLLPPRVVVSRNACLSNLKMIEGAKDTWALENKKTGTDTPTESDLFGSGAYIREAPTCPQGGIYRVGAVNEKPTCSLGGNEHTCP